jgi:lysozyme family protein
MATFELAIGATLQHEGGAKYTNRKNDHGGPTKYGITRRTLQDWRQRKVTAADVKALTEKEACDIYRARYWDLAQCDRIRDQSVAAKIFDMAVNFGIMRRGTDAAEITQRAVVACGRPIRIDGWVGPETIGGVNGCHPTRLLPELCAEQKRAYLAIIRCDPTQEENRRGWLKRARWKGGA